MNQRFVRQATRRILSHGINMTHRMNEVTKMTIVTDNNTMTLNHINSIIMTTRTSSVTRTINHTDKTMAMKTRINHVIAKETCSIAMVMATTKFHKIISLTLTLYKNYTINLSLSLTSTLTLVIIEYLQSKCTSNQFIRI